MPKHQIKWFARSCVAGKRGSSPVCRCQRFSGHCEGGCGPQRLGQSGQHRAVRVLECDLGGTLATQVGVRVGCEGCACPNSWETCG